MPFERNAQRRAATRLAAVPPRHVQIRWILGLAVLLVAGAAIVGWFVRFGRDVALEFYAAASQIIPVLLLAVLLELAVLHSPFAELREADYQLTQSTERLERLGAVADEERAELGQLRATLAAKGRFVRTQVVGYVLAAAVGQAASLYAVAAEVTTTFLVLLTAGSIAATFVILIATYVRRFSLESA